MVLKDLGEHKVFMKSILFRESNRVGNLPKQIALQTTVFINDIYT